MGSQPREREQTSVWVVTAVRGSTEQGWWDPRKPCLYTGMVTEDFWRK